MTVSSAKVCRISMGRSKSFIMYVAVCLVFGPKETNGKFLQDASELIGDRPLPKGIEPYISILQYVTSYSVSILLPALVAPLP